MRIWVYRPDKKNQQLDLSLLYFKGKTADKEDKEVPHKQKIHVYKQTKNTVPKSHYVEVPYYR